MSLEEDAIKFMETMSPVENLAAMEPSFDSPAYASKKLCSVKTAMLDILANIDNWRKTESRVE